MNADVLIVEDNRDLAENVAELLQEEGARTRLFADAERAAEAARDGFDIALVDIRLGGGASGLELIPRLKRHSAFGEVILMTGNATVDSAIDAIRQGVYAYLPKPFEPEQLLTLARRAFAQVALKKEKQSLAERLEASEALHRGVVDTVEACILGLDERGVIQLANPFAALCSGRSQQQLAGMHFAEFCGGEEAMDRLRAVAAGEVVRDQEHVLVRPDGSQRHLRWTLTALDVTAGAERGRRAPRAPVILAVGIDVTERLELERRNAENEALAAMGTLTTGLAHEIRNPLNAAKLQLELVMRRARRRLGGDVDDVIEPALLVRDELQRLSNLLDDFLRLARPRGVERIAISARELLESVIELQRPVADGARIELARHVEPEDLQIMGDPDKLKQVLINLVGNAIDAMRQRAYGNVHIYAQQASDGWVELCVLDDGPGVSPSVMAEAFKPFVTSKEAGTGLGLTIVQRIVQQHGGSVSLSPAPDGGTRACVRLPGRDA